MRLTLQFLSKQQLSSKRQPWIDSLRIYCKSGNGGHGLPQYGGLGGNGGSVIFKVSEEKKTKKQHRNPTNLTDLFKKEFKSDPTKQRIEAKNGQHSSKQRLNGASGKDSVFEIPRGVTISDDKGNLLADLNDFGQSYTAAIGGEGGSDLTNFIGLPGQRKFVRLDLKLLADIGLVGFPNAGKSTLLNAISNAKPRIASFPFTTIHPNLGHIKYQDLRTITMADLPGLIEGSHKNLGMGHRFLRHVERTKLLLFIVDVNGFQLGPEYPHRTAFENLVLLNRELELYNPDLLKKPSVLVVNKMDTKDSMKKLKHFEYLLETNYEEGISTLPEDMVPESKLEFQEVLKMSAEKDEKSVMKVKQQLRVHLDEAYQDSNSDKVKALSDELDTVLDTDNKFMI